MIQSKRMGKAAAVLILAALAAIWPDKTVYAGGINGEESRVIGVAKGTFEYKGEEYVAKQSYIDSLVSKLSQDDYDLSGVEADEAILGIYANVEKGVQEGYIVKKGESDVEADADTEGTQTKDAKDTPDKDAEQTQEAKPPVPYQAPSIIKDTGYSLQGTVCVLLFGGMFTLFTCIYIVVGHWRGTI